MGCCLTERKRTKVQNEQPHNRQQEKQKSVVLRCPSCNMKFLSKMNNSEINLHIEVCLQNPIVAKLITTNKPNKRDRTQNRENQQYWELVEKNGKKQWVKHLGDYEAVEQIVKDMDLSEISEQVFIFKQIWLRYQLDKTKISWIEGAEKLPIDSKRLLETTLIYNRIFNTNMRKEVKIEFIGEQVMDAGGLLREYFLMLMKKLSSPEIGILEPTDNKEERAYRIHQNLKTVDTKTVENLHILYFRILGILIGKSILEKIPINMYFDRTLQKHILGQNITIDDIKYYDTGLYNQLSYVKQLTPESDDDLGLNFTTQIKQQQQIVQDLEFQKIGAYSTVPLIENGENIPVVYENKDKFIREQIYFHTAKSVQPYLDAMLTELYKVYKHNKQLKSLFSIFNQEELDVVLSGLPFIDIKEWRENTIYQGQFHENHDEVVKWFWQVLEELSEHQLRMLLQFCTGSQRLPIEGFSKLESNRNVISPFCIEIVQFDDKHIFPVAHTCFNRLDIPTYGSYDQLKEMILMVISEDLQGVYAKD